MMDRAEWLHEKRSLSERRYDVDFSSTYDANDEPMDATHRQFVADVIARCPPRGRILDMPCGTGKYFAMIMDAGLSVTGCDQSEGMLAQAAAKPGEARTHKLGLQELAFESSFDAAICVDAMEDVPPEQWPLVLSNFHRAIRPAGHLYFTVEMTDADWLVKAFAEATAQGLPVVPNEDVTRSDGYHYYPPLAQVREWLHDAAFVLVRETHSDGGHPSYSYEHFLARRA